jgi:hypothetical protein
LTLLIAEFSRNMPAIALAPSSPMLQPESIAKQSSTCWLKMEMQLTGQVDVRHRLVALQRIGQSSAPSTPNSVDLQKKQHQQAAEQLKSLVRRGKFMAYRTSRCEPTTRCWQARRPALWRLRRRWNCLQTTRITPHIIGRFRAIRRWLAQAHTCQVDSCHRLVDFQRVGQRFGAVVADLVVCTRVHTKRPLSSTSKKYLQRPQSTPLTTQIHLLQRLIAFERTGQRNGAGDANLVGCETWISKSDRTQKQERRRRCCLQAKFDSLHRRVHGKRFRQRCGTAVANFVIWHSNNTRISSFFATKRDSMSIFLTIQTDVHQRLVDFERAGQRLSAFDANFIICNSDHQRCEWQKKRERGLCCAHRSDKSWSTPSCSWARRPTRWRRRRQFCFLEPGQKKKSDVNHNAEQKKKSALTTQVDVDNCGVFLEQLGQRFGAVVADLRSLQKKKYDCSDRKRDAMRSHDKSMLFTDVLLMSAVANVLALSPRILLPGTQVFFFEKKKKKSRRRWMTARFARPTLALTRQANARQRRVSFEHVGQRFDAVVADAVPWTGRKKKTRLGNLQRLIEGIWTIHSPPKSTLVKVVLSNSRPAHALAPSTPISLSVARAQFDTARKVPPPETAPLTAQMMLVTDLLLASASANATLPSSPIWLPLTGESGRQWRLLKETEKAAAELLTDRSMLVTDVLLRSAAANALAPSTPIPCLRTTTACGAKTVIAAQRTRRRSNAQFKIDAFDSVVGNLGWRRADREKQTRARSVQNPTKTQKIGADRPSKSLNSAFDINAGRGWLFEPSIVQ